jgi:hypothetical protein
MSTRRASPLAPIGCIGIEDAHPRSSVELAVCCAAHRDMSTSLALVTPASTSGATPRQADAKASRSSAVSEGAAPLKSCG